MKQKYNSFLIIRKQLISGQDQKREITGISTRYISLLLTETGAIEQFRKIRAYKCCHRTYSSGG